jgi:Tol biopolymer transport system component
VGTDGSGLTQVTHLQSQIVTAPIWSPDGSRILFQQQTAISPEIVPAEVMVVPAEGGQARSVTPGMWGWEPTWVAHGDSIQYLADDNLVTVVSVDGSGRRVVGDLSDLGQVPHRPLFARWSVNGREAIMTRYISGDLEIYTVNADGTHLRNLTRNAASWEQDPDW